MRVTDGFEDGVGCIRLAEAVEQAQIITGRNRFIEFADENRVVVLVHKFGHKFAY